MNTLKAIETVYNGFHFRSRTEARWAVFFEEMRIEFSYEMEGFNLPSGRYLPDFWLHQVGMWAEVKGKKFTDHEIGLCMELAAETGARVLLLDAAPGFRSYDAVHERGVDTDFLLTDWHLDEGRFYGCTGRDSHHAVETVLELQQDGEYRNAIFAARGARFEFGQKGARR